MNPTRRRCKAEAKTRWTWMASGRDLTEATRAGQPRTAIGSHGRILTMQMEYGKIRSSGSHHNKHLERFLLPMHNRTRISGSHHHRDQQQVERMKWRCCSSARVLMDEHLDLIPLGESKSMQARRGGGVCEMAASSLHELPKHYNVLVLRLIACIVGFVYGDSRCSFASQAKE